jgi:hypothetical protein
MACNCQQSKPSTQQTARLLGRADGNAPIYVRIGSSHFGVLRRDTEHWVHGDLIPELIATGVMIPIEDSR